MTLFCEFLCSGAIGEDQQYQRAHKIYFVIFETIERIFVNLSPVWEINNEIYTAFSFH